MSLARATDPETSHAAAESVRVTRTAQCLHILETYAYADEDGLTSEEAARATREVDIESCWWHRVTDLQQNGYLDFLRDEAESIVKRDTGRSGRDRRVYVITDKGLDALDTGEIFLDAEVQRKEAKARQERVDKVLADYTVPASPTSNRLLCEVSPVAFAAKVARAWRG